MSSGMGVLKGGEQSVQSTESARDSSRYPSPMNERRSTSRCGGERVRATAAIALVAGSALGCGGPGEHDAAETRQSARGTAASTLELGPWRASLASPGGPLTFGLDLEQGESGRLRAVLVNGEERRKPVAVNPIPGGVIVELAPYRARLVAEVSDDGRSLVGRWERDGGDGFVSVLPFAAVASDAEGPGASQSDAEHADLVSGRWRVLFEGDEHPAVGEFEVESSGEATGTFLTTLGDYRYLAGRLDGEQLMLSCFDGAHAFLFTATLDAGETPKLDGDFWSRDSYHTTWTATRDPDAQLPDDFALTEWTSATGLGDLAFSDLDGATRSLDDPEFIAPARLLVVFGTWCPNCNDLTEYLVQLQNSYESLSILGVAFERGDDSEAHARAVRDYMEYHGADWPVLLCGGLDKTAASAALPVLDRVRAYPTTVFMDERGNVSAVHTGFSGPATGERYARLKQRFESEIEALIGD